MRRFTFYGLMLGVAAIAIGVGIDLLVETDEERIEALVDRIGSAATVGDAERLSPLVDLDGDGLEVVLGRTRDRFGTDDVEAFDQLVAEISEWLDGGTIRVTTDHMEVSGDRAQVYLRVEVERPDSPAEVFPVDLTLRRVDDAWRATRFRATGTHAGRAARR
jgi:hypothetical protein